MQSYEYRVVPAPKRGEKARGAKTTPDRFAVALMTVMNKMGAEGWEYLRADTLPCEERVGLTGKATAFHHMLVFRRTLAAAETTPVRPETTLSRIPTELFDDPEPQDLYEMKDPLPPAKPRPAEAAE